MFLRFPTSSSCFQLIESNFWSNGKTFSRLVISLAVLYYLLDDSRVIRAAQRGTGDSNLSLGLFMDITNDIHLFFQRVNKRLDSASLVSEAICKYIFYVWGYFLHPD